MALKRAVAPTTRHPSRKFRLSGLAHDSRVVQGRDSHPGRSRLPSTGVSGSPCCGTLDGGAEIDGMSSAGPRAVGYDIEG